MSSHVSEDDLYQRNQGYAEHEHHRNDNHKVVFTSSFQPYAYSQQGEGSQQLVCRTENRPNGQIRT